MKNLYIFSTKELKKFYNMQDSTIFDIFVDKIIKPVTSGLKMVDEFQKIIIITEIAYGLKEKLRYFKDIKPGYVKSIASLIGELKFQGITPEVFGDIFRNTDKYSDLELIYNEYESFLHSKGLFDKEDRYLLCIDNIKNSRFVKDYDIIIFKYFYGLTYIQKKIVDMIKDKVIIEDTPIDPHIDKLSVIEARDRITEVYKLAHVISGDIESGIDINDIAIVVRDRALYADLIKDVFSKAGIPVRIDKSEALIRNPFIKGFFDGINGNANTFFNAAIMDNYMALCNWADLILGFLSELGFPEKIIDIHGDDIFLIKRDLEAFKILRDMLMQISELGRYLDSRNMNKHTYLELLKDYVDDTEYSYGIFQFGIPVLNPTQLRGLKYRKIYSIGMVEGEYPREMVSDFVLKDDERKLLNDRGYGIDTIDILLERERQTLDFILSCSDDIYMSYPDILENDVPSLMSDYINIASNSADTITNEKVDFMNVYVYKDIDMGNREMGIQGLDLNGFLDKFVFSVSSFDTYIQCPYRFFLSYILGLEQPKSEEFTVKDEGSMYHEVLKRFILKHKDGLKKEDVDEYHTELMQIIDQVFKESNVASMFANQEVYELKKYDLSTVLTDLIDKMPKLCGDFMPYGTEIRFGYDGGFDINGIKFKGLIDRIDVSKDGRYVVYDYKRSSTPNFKEIVDLKDIQMQVYLLAAERYLGNVAGGCFISVKNANVGSIIVRDTDLPFVSKRKKNGIFDDEGWKRFFEDFKARVKDYHYCMVSGNYPINPTKCPKLDGFGAFCEYQDICPFEGELS